MTRSTRNVIHGEASFCTSDRHDYTGRACREDEPDRCVLVDELSAMAWADTSNSPAPPDAARSPGAHTSSGSRGLDLVPQHEHQADAPLQAPLVSWPFPRLDAANDLRPRRC